MFRCRQTRFLCIFAVSVPPLEKLLMEIIPQMLRSALLYGKKKAQENRSTAALCNHTSQPKEMRANVLVFFSYFQNEPPVAHWYVYLGDAPSLDVHTLLRVSLWCKCLWESRHEVNHIKREVVRLGARRPERFPLACDSAWSGSYRESVSICLSALSY